MAIMIALLVEDCSPPSETQVYQRDAQLIPVEHPLSFAWW